MHNDIEKALLRLKIEAKEIRKKMRIRIAIFSFLVIITYLIWLYFPSQLGAFFGLWVLVIFFAGAYIFFGAIPKLFNPLSPEYIAFKSVAEAIEILEKSNEPIAYEEAYRCIKKARNKLEYDMELSEVTSWYHSIDEILNQFFENLELIVLPEVAESNIKIEHLEEIALALSGLDIEAIKKVNATLETSYKKRPAPPRKGEILVKIFRETSVGKLLTSLAMGFGLILIISFVFAIGTEQEFMTFLRENPEIVILGGLGISGISIWKRKK